MVRFWLGGFAEAYLVGEDDAIASCSKVVRGLLPSWATEVFAMQKHGGLAIRWACWRNVHEGHLKPLPSLRRELIKLHGPGVDKLGAIQIEGDVALLDAVFGGCGHKTEKA